MRNKFLLIVPLMGLLSVSRLGADQDTSLYKDSIQSTKDSIAQETLDVLYHDGLDYYHEERYDDALQLFDKIYSINPHYEDVASLRDTIHKKQQSTQTEITMDTVKSWMKKGDKAMSAGQKVLAISYWKQALQINPNYAPAQKKIQEVNQALAKKEFETGYIHYHHGELEDALESWSNAVALDPTYKQRGLLLLMSKIELQVKNDQVSKLAAQGFDQYQQGMLEDSLHSYEDLTAIEPRHEEARRMTAKIKIQLGSVALKAAQLALAHHDYAEASLQADKAIGYGYQLSRAQTIKEEAQHAIQVASQPRPPKKNPEKKQVVAASSAPATAVPLTTPVPTSAADAEDAMVHYRQGMGAIRKKDFHLAIDELDIAYKLDPSNERIYMARERARQEWNSTTASPHDPMKTLLKDLNWKFGVVMALILMSVMIAEQSLLMKQARSGMESRLSEKASFINTFYAFLIADALQRKDDVTLLQVINRLEEDPEILSVVVVDDKEEIRYHADSDKLGTLSTDAAIHKALLTGDGIMSPAQNVGGRALVLVSPLKAQGVARPLGAVRIEFTYHHVQDQLAKFDNSFHLAVIGFISAGIGFFMIFIRRWIVTPLENVEKAVSTMHLATAEPNLPESSDEFGRLNKALNDMILRFRTELHEQLGTGVVTPGELEKELAERLLQSFFPEDLLIIANKDNKIVSQTQGGQAIPIQSDHLLDLITDKNFANLVGPAYQEEGKVMRGPVLVQDQPYDAAVLCVPDNQSKTIKTVIVLQAQLKKGDS